MKNICVYDQCVSFGDSLEAFIQLEFIFKGCVSNKVMAWPTGYGLTDKELAVDLFDVVKDLATVRIFNSDLNLRSTWTKDGIYSEEFYQCNY